MFIIYFRIAFKMVDSGIFEELNMGDADDFLN